MLKQQIFRVKTDSFLAESSFKRLDISFLNKLRENRV